MDNIMNKIKKLESTFKITTEFPNGLKLYDENNHPNILSTYIMANTASDLFLNNLKEKDIDHKYNKITGEAEVFSDDLSKTAEKLYELMIRDGFPDYINEIESKKLELKQSHPEWWREQVCLPNTSFIYKDYKIINLLNNIIKNLSIEECIQGYKASKEILKFISNDELTPFCIDSKIMLNYEFKEEYDNELNKIKERYNIPNKKEWIESLKLPKIKINKTRLCLDRQPCNNLDSFELFINFWYKYFI